MIIKDLQQLNKNKYDICIIGAGPAGISTALALPSSVKVLIVEAGGMHYSVASQEHYKGKVIGDRYYDLDTCRLRQLGGTSGHWLGKCRTLDHFDYAFKPYAEKAVWPIQRKDLDQYLLPASTILDIPPKFDTQAYAWDDNVQNLHFQFSPPVRFKDKYLDQIAKSRNVSMILETALSSVELKNDAIKAITLSATSKDKIRVKASKYVFAMGGIENGRMLKYVGAENPHSTLSQNKNVGAYWMEHPHHSVGDFFYNRPDNAQWHVGISETQKRKMQILNANLHFTTYNPYDSAGKTKELLRDLICASETIGAEVSYRLGKNYCGGTIDAAWEQEPRAENRIDLDTAVDDFGIPKAILRWEKSALDFKTIRLTAEYVAQSMAKHDIAKVRLYEWLWTEQYPEEGMSGGFHHMGGTRMSDNKKEGVVDPNMRCWDVSNLYIAGSSVFPSSGHANPTLTIVQLAVRLAKHLTT